MKIVAGYWRNDDGTIGCAARAGEGVGCVARDGLEAEDRCGHCVGCNRSSADMLAALVQVATRP